MSNVLQNSQLTQLTKRYAKLSIFQMLIDEDIGEGYLDNLLKIQDDNGDYPIITALGVEPLSLLVERCQAIGGDANIFVLTHKGVRYITAHTDGPRSVDEIAVDLSDFEQWKNGNADISAFIDVLLREGKPVTLPGELPCSLDMYNADVKLREKDEVDYLVSIL